MKLTILNGKPAFVHDGGRPVYTDIYVGIRYHGNMYNVLTDFQDKCWTVSETEPFSDDSKNLSIIKNAKYYIAKTDNAELYAAVTENDVLLRSCIINGDEERTPFQIVSLGGLWHDRLERVMYNGIFSPHGVKVFDMTSESGVRILSENENIENAVHTTVIDKSGETLHLGHVSFEKYFTGVFTCEDGCLETRIYNEERKIAPKERVFSDWIRLSFGRTPSDILFDYARFVRDFCKIQKRFDRAPVGFCTWYYYMNNINERTVFENMEICDKIRSRVPLEVFEIDDGWGTARYGDGNPERFPKGMKFYADYIKEHGMIPGIWFNALDFKTDEPLVSEHPECFVHDGDGNLVLMQGRAVLDATHPASVEFLKNMFKKVTYDWGYRYLKLDIVTDYLTGGVYYEKGAGPLQNLRSYFRCAREFSHPDTYILGCTAPMFEIAEFVDGMRISLDIFERWDSLTRDFCRIYPRFYMNGILFWNDPDCLLIRKKENEDGDCRRYCIRNDTEIRTFETAMYAAGGALMISDKLPLMSDAQINDYAGFFPRKDSSAVPLDFTESSLPSVLDCGTEGNIRTVAFINWSERPRTFAIPLGGKYHATEHWDGVDSGDFDGEYKVTLKPHESNLVHLEKRL